MVTPPLSVNGRNIVDSDGQRVKLVGANWNAHNDLMIPGGLHLRHRDQIADTIVSYGLNSIRFTFALKMFDVSTPVSDTFIKANPDLHGASPFQVYQACVKSMTNHGIMVIPNCHLLFPGVCCADVDGNGLWWNSNWPESKFYNGWVKLATTFKDNPLVIGYDLKNEPRNTTTGGVLYKPSWGDRNSKTDFRLAYEKAGTMIHSVDPTALLFCEGLSYATNLRNAASQPVMLANKTVYSMHDYSWFHTAGMAYADYKAAMDVNGGYLVRDNIAPVWIGEFGVNIGNPLVLGSTWIGNFFTYARERDLDVCWWLLDGTAHVGHQPTTNVPKEAEGAREGFGLLKADWTNPTNMDLMCQLNDVSKGQ